MDDSELLLQYARRQSEAAFTELVRRHLGLVYFAALRRLNGNRHHAEDVSQTVFVALAAQAEKLSKRDSIAGWLYATTRNAAVQIVRSETRRAARELEVISMEATHDADSVDRDQLRPVIDDILDRLAERDRELVLLHYFQSLGFAEIGARCGLSADAARLRVNRALEKIRVALRKRGIHSTSAALSAALVSQAGAAVPSATLTAVTASAWAKTVAASGWTTAAATESILVMSTTKIVAGAALAAACISGTLIFREVQLIELQRSRLSAEQTSEHEIQVQIARAQSDFSATLRASAARSPAVHSSGTGQNAKANANGGSAALAASPSPAKPNPSPINWKFCADPAARALFMPLMKANLSSNLAEFFRNSHFTPEKIDAFENLLMERDVQVGPTIVLTTRPQDMSVQEVDTQIRNFLGDAGYNQYQAYAKTEFVRPIATGLAATIYTSSLPLTAQQADALTTIFAANIPQSATPYPASVDWTKTLQQAAQVLSSDQSAALGKLVTALNPQTMNYGLFPTLPGMFANGLNPPVAINDPQFSKP